MENPFKKNENDVKVRQTRILTATDFFGKKDGGYCEKDDFIIWGESSRTEDIHNVAKFLKLVKDGNRIVDTSITRTDKGNRPYKYITFILASKFSDGAKLIQEGPWPCVLDDLQKGLIEINFTLDELIEEAKKA